MPTATPSPTPGDYELRIATVDQKKGPRGSGEGVADTPTSLSMTPPTKRCTVTRGRKAAPFVSHTPVPGPDAVQCYASERETPGHPRGVHLGCPRQCPRTAMKGHGAVVPRAHCTGPEPHTSQASPQTTSAPPPPPPQSHRPPHAHAPRPS